MIHKNKYDNFKEKVIKKIQDGQWSINEIEYLHQHKLEYHLHLEEIGMFLTEVYKYTYHAAMEDGIITDHEAHQLQNIKNYFKKTMAPRNRYEVEKIKQNILALRNKFINSKVFDLQASEINEQEIKSIYNYPRLRLRPPGAYTPF